MSAITITKQPRRIRSQEHGGFATQVRMMFARLQERFGSMRFPAYVSAFEGEHLQALAEWSDCRTGITRQPINEDQDGGEQWK